MPPAAMTATTRKRLGQFFTGDRLARLLAALAGSATSDSAIDPMGGSGDMIAAVLMQNPRADAALIEIEPVAAGTAADRFGKACAVVRGSAFERACWERLRSSWDLVITNPPYVRYQTGSSDDGAAGFDIPSAERVRSGLVEVLNNNTNLNTEERDAFLHCAWSYSGLADLAVPSWLLCASKVRVGGRLAVLAPNTWLSRDYASPVLYILRRFFEIEYVVEDTDMTWFAEALVRTTLVVARRTSDKGTALAPSAHLRIGLPAALANDASIVGAGFPHSTTPEQDFAAAARELLVGRMNGSVAGAEAQLSDESDLIEVLRKAGRRRPWPCTVETDHDGPEAIPERFRQVLPGPVPDVVSLEDLGWQVGQGLRSGANDFFYVTRTLEGFESSLMPGQTLSLPEDAVRPAVRRQADLPSDRRSCVAGTTASYVLVLDGWALPEDIQSADGPTPYKPMSGDLARLTRTAITYTYDRAGAAVSIPELSAVRTNVRAGRANSDTPARFWYQLPSLAPRHTPSLYMARVNGGPPLAYVNVDGKVIDANFSTLWPVTDDALPAAALLAMLRTAWADAFLEVLGTVLGGGALKIEASHLRRLMLPRPDPDAADALRSRGERLIDGTSADDELIGLSAAVDSRSTTERLRELAAKLRSSRAMKAKKSAQ